MSTEQKTDEAVEMLINVLSLAYLMGQPEIPLPVLEVRGLAVYSLHLRKGIREICEAEDGTLVSREVREKLLALINDDPENQDTFDPMNDELKS